MTGIPWSFHGYKRFVQTSTWVLNRRYVGWVSFNSPLANFEFVLVNLNLHIQWRIWVCRGRFEFAMANLNLSRWIWICCRKYFGEFDFAMVNLNLVWRIWIFRSEVEFSVANLILPRSMWICRGELEFSVLSLNLLQWWIWICRSEYTVVNFNLLCWI